MDTLNFIFSENNKSYIDKHLQSFGYKKIGQQKANNLGYCIMKNRKEFFEIENSENPNIFTSSNISDFYQFCL